MKNFHSLAISASDFSLPEIPLGGTAVINIKLSHWDGAPLDMDLEVSYDGMQSWMYGGGCRGAVSESNGIEFHLKYGQEPTHLRGKFHSDGAVNSVLEVLGE